MSLPNNTERQPPPLWRRTFMKATAVLCLAIFALVLVKTNAYATEGETEPGIINVQYRFADYSGDPRSTTQQAYATYTDDRQSYTARINASGGVVDMKDCFQVNAGGEDITQRCTYESRTGLVSIPKTYSDETVNVVVDLDAQQSATAVTLNISIVAGAKPGQSSSLPLEVAARQTRIAIPVPGAVKAVTQDSRVLDTSEYNVTNGVLTLEGRTALMGSITVYLEGFAPEVIQRNAIKDYNDTIIQRSLRMATHANTLARSNLGGWFDGWGWIWSTNQGPGDWDYTDYTMNWNGNSIYLTCCEHGIYHMPQSEGGGGSVYFTASLVSNSLINQYNTTDATTIYHHKVYRNTYYVYVDAGWYQDVDGYFSEDYETVTTSPRLGGIDLNKVSANPSITDNNPSYSVEGATYGVFSDAACTSQLNSLTTNANGATSLWGFYAGSVIYIKETKASPGFDLDPNVYQANITADQYTQVNGGIVYEPPQTVTVRYFVDGDPSPIYADSGLPLGLAYDLDAPGLVRATNLAQKPNCTPGLNSWYTDKALTEKYRGSTLHGNLDLYARNVATLTYALAPSSVLTADFEVRASMSENSPPLSIQYDILPPSRLVNWGSTVTLIEPEHSALYHFDTERWRTLRRNNTGWHDSPSLIDTAKSSKKIECDTTVYTDYLISTYDGIVMW